MEEEKKIIEAEETKVEEPIIEKEATPVVENEPMDEDFADAAPKVEPKKEEEIKPEPEPEPEPDLPPLFPELSSYEYNDERLAKIEEARVTYHKTAKKRGLIHTILIIGTLVLMIAGYLIPFLAIPDEETKMRVALICALAGAVIGLVTSAVYGFIQRKKDKQTIRDYFEAYYNNLNSYVFEGLEIENLHGDVDAKITKEEVMNCALYPQVAQVGSRDNLTFQYKGMDVALCDMAAQKDAGRSLRTVFVGKYLRAHNSIEGLKENLVFYFKGNKRSLPPESLPKLNCLHDDKKYAVYGAREDYEKLFSKKRKQMLESIQTNQLLVDVAISIQNGRSYFCLGYEDTLMILPWDKPFCPGYVELFKPQIALFLELAKAFEKEEE